MTINKQLQSILENVSKDGFLEQMLRGNFLDEVVADTELAKYILENLNSRSKKKIILEGLQEKNPDATYAYEKELVLKYLSGEDKYNNKKLEASDVLGFIPKEAIVSDKEFVRSIVITPSQNVLFFDRELAAALEKQDWFVPMLTDERVISLSLLSVFDDTDHDNNLNVVKIKNDNFTHLSLKAQGNPLLIEEVLGNFKVENEKIRVSRQNEILEYVAKSITDFEKMVKDLPDEEKKSLANNYHLVTKENYKNFLMDFGVFVDGLNADEFSKVLEIRRKKLLNTPKAGFENDSFISELVSKTPAKDPILSDIKVAYPLLKAYKDFISSDIKRPGKDDVLYVKTIVKKVNASVCSKFVKDYEKEHGELSKTANMDELKKYLDAVIIPFFEQYLETTSPKNDVKQGRALKF